MPFDTETLVYDYNSHRYLITLDGARIKLGVSLDNELGSYNEANIFIKQVSERLYRWLYSYIRKEGVRVIEKRIADNFTPASYGLPYREGIEEALYAQVEYMLNFDGDLQAQSEGNKDKLISTEAKQILHYYGIAHKGSWSEVIEEEDFRVGY